MKFFKIFLFFLVAAVAFGSCKNENKNIWAKEIKTSEKAEIIDISADFYNPAIPLEKFKEQYSWFQGTVPDDIYGERRTDSLEIAIYREASKKINRQKLQNDLNALFSRVKHYFPNFQSPKVYLYSSALQSITDPIFLEPRENLLFVDVSAFLGENNPHYKGLEKYYQVSMNFENLLPRISETIAFYLVPRSSQPPKFIDELLYEGKVMTLQDAFLPQIPDHLKMSYSEKQLAWSRANEENIWNYFVENDLIFSDDPMLRERFIAPGPFSKFYTEVDNNSSPRTGIFIGWQIARTYFEKKPETSLQKFLQLDATEIFNEAGYKPKTP